MITVAWIPRDESSITVTHCVNLIEGVAVAAALKTDGTVFLIEDREVAVLCTDPIGHMLIEASGWSLLRLHAALTGVKLYRFTVRSIALTVVLEELRERHPPPDVVPALPMIESFIQGIAAD